MADIKITCKDCGNDFVFTESEQAFYKEKGFENQPVRCPACRKLKKASFSANRNNNRPRRDR
ncbi:MAG TPA: zinc-ribbon domain-containing protein [Clostridia bacterium]|nr:zinc-ribbon domain-containing protein [Clostridia bacterium]